MEILLGGDNKIHSIELLELTMEVPQSRPDSMSKMIMALKELSWFPDDQILNVNVTARIFNKGLHIFWRAVQIHLWHDC